MKCGLDQRGPNCEYSRRRSSWEDIFDYRSYIVDHQSEKYFFVTSQQIVFEENLAFLYKINSSGTEILPKAVKAFRIEKDFIPGSDFSEYIQNKDSVRHLFSASLSNDSIEAWGNRIENAKSYSEITRNIKRLDLLYDIDLVQYQNQLVSSINNNSYLEIASSEDLEAVKAWGRVKGFIDDKSSLISIFKELNTSLDITSQEVERQILSGIIHYSQDLSREKLRKAYKIKNIDEHLNFLRDMYFLPSHRDRKIIRDFIKSYYGESQYRDKLTLITQNQPFSSQSDIEGYDWPNVSESVFSGLLRSTLIRNTDKVYYSWRISGLHRDKNILYRTSLLKNCPGLYFDGVERNFFELDIKGDELPKILELHKKHQILRKSTLFDLLSRVDSDLSNELLIGKINEMGVLRSYRTIKDALKGRKLTRRHIKQIREKSESSEWWIRDIFYSALRSQEGEFASKVECGCETGGLPA